MKKRDVWSLIAVFATIAAVLASSFALFTAVETRNTLNQQLKESLREELTKYDFPKNEVKNITIDEAKIYLSVAKYCSETNSCRGDNGKNGRDGRDGASGSNGQNGDNGLTPPCYFTQTQCQGENGVNGAEGQQGPAGENGRPIERRCEPEKRQMEWRIVGDVQWQPEYNLAPGQTCVTEE